MPKLSHDEFVKEILSDPEVKKIYDSLDEEFNHLIEQAKSKKITTKS